MCGVDDACVREGMSTCGERMMIMRERENVHEGVSMCMRSYALVTQQDMHASAIAEAFDMALPGTQGMGSKPTCGILSHSSENAVRIQVDSRNKKGFSALHFAVMRNLKSVVCYLW